MNLSVKDDDRLDHFSSFPALSSATYMMALGNTHMASIASWNWSTLYVFEIFSMGNLPCRCRSIKNGTNFARSRQRCHHTLGQSHFSRITASHQDGRIDLGSAHMLKDVKVGLHSRTWRPPHSSYALPAPFPRTQS